LLFFFVFICTESRSANQNPRRRVSRPLVVRALPPPSRLSHYFITSLLHYFLLDRHRDKNPLAAAPLVPADCKCPLPQPLSLHILTNAPGVWGSTIPFLMSYLNSAMRQSIPFVFTLIRTLLCTPKTQLISFQSIPHSLRKIPGGGGGVRRTRQRRRSCRPWPRSRRPCAAY
jgi:hypothetical protein